jgi:hypothetical protein
VGVHWNCYYNAADAALLKAAEVVVVPLLLQRAPTVVFLEGSKVQY